MDGTGNTPITGLTSRADRLQVRRAVREVRKAKVALRLALDALNMTDQREDYVDLFDAQVRTALDGILRIDSHNLSRALEANTP